MNSQKYVATGLKSGKTFKLTSSRYFNTKKCRCILRKLTFIYLLPFIGGVGIIGPGLGPAPGPIPGPPGLIGICLESPSSINSGHTVQCSSVDY